MGFTLSCPVMPSRAISLKHPCETLTDFLFEVNKVRSRWRSGKEKSKGDSRPLWFRGQRSAEWDLRPRLYRDEYRGAAESEIRLEFEGSGLQLVTTNPNRSKWEWYFLMEHYRAPTRLLNWSGNPLVALYFAVSDESSNRRKGDASVWMFDPWRWNSLHFDSLSGPGLPGWEETEAYLPDLEQACDGEKVARRWPIAIEPPSIDRRLANQTARFLLFGKRRDLIKAADRTDLAAKKGSRLKCILISAGKLERLQYELDDVGINRRTLFPDLDGLGEHLSWEWKRFVRRTRLY